MNDKVIPVNTAWHVNGMGNIADQNDHIIAAICISPDSTADELKARSRLLAAAPDLLAACRDALGEVVNHPDGHMMQFQLVEARLKAAIAKAEVWA